jgi:Flp pilus assembly pilin Flp
VSRLLRLLDDEMGATAIEYAMIAVFIALVLVAVFPAIKEKLGATFNSISGALS